MIRVFAVILVSGMGLAACTPVPLEQAQKGCAREIQTRGVPQSGVTFGVSTGNAWLGNTSASGVSFGFGTGGAGAAVSTTIPTGETPDFDAAYARCVKARSGQAPTASLGSQLQ